MAVETCMCGRILAQKGETCVKDDTVKLGDAGNKNRKLYACFFYQNLRFTVPKNK